MKRRKLSQVIAVTLAVCMLAGCVLTGCGSKSDNTNKETTQNGSILIWMTRQILIHSILGMM